MWQGLRRDPVAVLQVENGVTRDEYRSAAELRQTGAPAPVATPGVGIGIASAAVAGGAFAATAVVAPRPEKIRNRLIRIASATIADIVFPRTDSCDFGLQVALQGRRNNVRDNA